MLGESKDFIVSKDGLRDFAETFLKILPNRAIIGLRGPLGAGKTTLVRHIAGSFGLEAEVHSPSYVLENRYENSTNSHDFSVLIRHWDLYRLSGAAFNIQEIISFSDSFSKELVLVEWPDVLPELAGFLNFTLDISFDPFKEDHRIIQISRL